MDARFAGSQRLGDRRRRRLAVETDDPQIEGSSEKPLAAPEGAIRSLHSEPIGNGASSAVPNLPIGGIVPAQWWKYLLGGTVGSLISGGLLVAAWYQSIWGTLAGTGIPRLFSLPDSPVAAWYSSLLLSLSAQLSLLIWWGRSRSHKDFDGRYHLWTKTAGVWLLFSFCAATGAHDSWSETILHFWPQSFRNAGVLMWLVPAIALGLNRLLTLNREMSNCRASRSLLFTAAALYAIAGTLRLDFELPVSEKVHQVLTAGTALSGHLALFMSLWVHARHVLHFTADPSDAPRRKLRIPRPHFRLPRFSLGWRRSAKAAGGISEPVPEKPTRRRKPRKVVSKDVEADEEVAAPAEVEAPVNVASRRTFRVDTRHASPPPAPEPEEVDRSEELPEESVVPDRYSNHSTARYEPEQEDERPIQVDDDQRAAAQCESDDEEDQDFGNQPKPDLRGMSKKQRRRILAELREKERINRRQ